MKSFLSYLSTFYQKHSATLKALTTLLTLLGATNYVPKSWWTSPILSWSINSQTTITILIVLFSTIVFAYSRIQELKKEIQTLVIQKKVKNLTPEEHADLTKQHLIYAARFYGHLLGLNNPKQDNKTNEIEQ